MSIELLETAIGGFTDELRKTPTSDWNSPTKCQGWDVTALMQHVVGGAIACSMALRGTPRAETAPLFSAYSFGADPVAEYSAAVSDHVLAFRELGDLSTVVQHPFMDMPAAQMLMFRIVDFAVHTWDLAAGMGRTVAIDPAVVQFCWTNTAPMAAGLAGTGLFGSGPSGTVPESADLQTRLLDVTGRRP